MPDNREILKRTKRPAHPRSARGTPTAGLPAVNASISGSGAARPLPHCHRCSSTKAEVLVQTRQMALYKCTDCGWRYGSPRA